MWRMDAHIGYPRYPWRASDGTILRVTGDAIWWDLLGGHLQKKIVRMPTIIGNYYSHPEDQAEFRQLPDDEMRLVNQVGVSSL